MVGSVQSSSTQDASAVTQQMQDFKDGKVNISKNDLKSSIASTIAQGEKPSTAVIDIIDKYEKIDTNGDGISYKELDTYKNTPAGLLSSLGLTPQAMKQQELSLFSSTFLGDDSATSSLFSTADDDSSFLGFGKLGDNPSRVLDNYSSTSTTSTETPNIVNLLS